MGRHTFLGILSLSWLLSSQVMSADFLPPPKVTPPIVHTLSLREAIALALRNNPSVRIAELQRITDKFGLRVSIWSAYEPQWTPLAITSTLQKSGPPQWGLSTGLSVTAPSGTETSLSYSNNLLGGFGQTQLSVTQHLLQGFGLALNRIPYDNAIDTEKVNRLNFKNSVITAVVNVITQYRNLVAAYNNLTTNEQTLKSEENEIWQTEQQVKAGKQSQNTLLQQKSNIQSTKLSVVQGQDALRNAYQDLTSSLGLPPDTVIKINRQITTDDVHVPSKKKAIETALAHNISYQTALIQLEITKRQLIQDEDKRKWTLDMTGSVTLGRERAVGESATTSLNQNPELGFSLSIPINDLSLKQAVVNDKIAIETAKINLAQQKQDLIRNVQNQLDSIYNQEEQLKIATEQISLQEQTLANARLQLKYGKDTIFEVNSYVNQLLSARINFIATQISFLQAVTTLYQTMGTTLNKWSIKLRY